jgi:hypothetical protein
MDIKSIIGIIIGIIGLIYAYYQEKESGASHY